MTTGTAPADDDWLDTVIISGAVPAPMPAAKPEVLRHSSHSSDVNTNRRCDAALYRQMGRFEDLKRLKDAAAAKLNDADLGKAASDAVVAASGLVDGAVAVAQRSGLTNKNGEISKFKVAKAAMRPGQTARTVLGATSEEIQARRASGEGSE